MGVVPVAQGISATPAAPQYNLAAVGGASVHGVEQLDQPGDEVVRDELGVHLVAPGPMSPNGSNPAEWGTGP